MPRLGWLQPLAVLAVVPAVSFAQVAPAPGAAPSAVVRAVLFYSPTCPHCHQVMTVDLPPLLQRYGPQLQIAGVNTATVGGQALYQATVARLAIPDDRLGVPTLVVGTRVLVGSLEIPNELPGIVDRGLAAGGIGWPNVPEIRQAVAQSAEAEVRREAAARDTPQAGAQAAPQPPAAAARADTPATVRRDTSVGERIPGDTGAARSRTPVAARAPSPRVEPPPGSQRSAGPVPDTGRAMAAITPVDGAATETAGVPSAWERFMLDPVGNGASVAVLVGMVAALALVSLSLLGRMSLPAAPSWVVPVLAVAGLGVASYLSFVEVTGTRAVCGPVGDCNTVQQSEYARLFGVLPVGVLGMAGYLGMVGLWLVGRLRAERTARAARLAAWGGALAGTLFSIYLTFLEPFVIGATCAWCLSSAVVVTLLLLVMTPAVRRDLSARGSRGEGGGA